MSRKIIQISATGVENNNQTQCSLVIMALCDDGSLWELNTGCTPAWYRYPDIPQDSEVNEKFNIFEKDIDKEIKY